MNTSTSLQNDTRETFPWMAKLVKALKRVDTHTPMDVLTGIERGKFQLWHRNNTIVVTSVLDYPQKRVCEVFCAAGDFEDVWALMDKEVEPWARNNGCKRIQGMGRFGWQRSAEDRGYRKTDLLMRKDL